MRFIPHSRSSSEDFRKNKRFAGLGVAMLPEFGITALDFDHCVDGGEVRGEVLRAVDHTYAEISPSGTGVRAFMLGSSRDGKNHADGFELFSGKGFVTITGNQIENAYRGLGMSLQRLDEATRGKLESMDANQRSSYTKALNLRVDSMTFRGRKLSGPDMVLNYPRHVIWGSSLDCLSSIWAQSVFAVKRNELIRDLLKTVERPQAIEPKTVSLLPPDVGDL